MGSSTWDSDTQPKPWVCTYCGRTMPFPQARRHQLTCHSTWPVPAPTDVPDSAAEAEDLRALLAELQA